jgi:hypothetical protein
VAVVPYPVAVSSGPHQRPWPPNLDLPLCDKGASDLWYVAKATIHKNVLSASRARTRDRQCMWLERNFRGRHLPHCHSSIRLSQTPLASPSLF